MDPTTIPATLPVDVVPSLDSIQLTTTAGVIAMTTLIVAVLKRIFGETPFFKKIPIFIYISVVALIVTAIANKVTHTLPGDLATLLWESLKAALGASGFYTWVTLRAAKPISETSTGGGTTGGTLKMFLIPALLIMPLSMTGCASLFGTPATIDADADAFVVNSERALAIAWADLSAFLTFDDQNRELLKSKAPSLHNAAEILRTDGVRSYESAVSAVRLYKRTRSPGDRPDAESKLEVVRDLARQARIALLAAQGVKTP